MGRYGNNLLTGQILILKLLYTPWATGLASLFRN